VYGDGVLVSAAVALAAGLFAYVTCLGCGGWAQRRGIGGMADGLSANRRFLPGIMAQAKCFVHHDFGGVPGF
jgi:hypothetical protein